MWNLAELRFRVLRVYGRVYGFEVWVWRLGFRRLGCRVGGFLGGFIKWRGALGLLDAFL